MTTRQKVRARMQIVIDIDKNLYNAVKDPSIDSGYYANECYNAVLCGTPLPKGHGALKDVTNLMRGLYTDMQTIEETFTSSDVYKMIDEECPTIIEADKE